jgi:hypothetical protein
MLAKTYIPEQIVQKKDNEKTCKAAGVHCELPSHISLYIVLRPEARLQLD